jgi:hypothetical protein
VVGAAAIEVATPVAEDFLDSAAWCDDEPHAPMPTIKMTTATTGAASRNLEPRTCA